ncbi:MAG: hypothetical protein SGJ00_13855 [bacterium]|nr:hypothetical protein [bacterium]
MKKILLFLSISLCLAFGTSFAQSTVSPDTVCAGSTNKIFDVPPTPGSTYYWSLKNGTTLATITTVSGRSDSILINFGSTPGVDTLRLVEVGPTGCSSDTVKLAIVILQNITVAITGTDSICINSASSGKLQLLFTGTPPYSVTFTDGTTPVVLTGILTSPYNITSPVFNTAGVKPYTITSASGLGSCPAGVSGAASVTVFPKPTPSAISHY